MFWIFIPITATNLYGEGGVFVCKIFIIIRLGYSCIIRCFLPYRLQIGIEYIFYLKLTDYPLYRIRSIHNNAFYIFTFEDTFSELIFFCPIKYFESKFRFN